MEDTEILALYNSRSEEAVAATRQKYGRYLVKIAYNILGDLSDCEEVLNDVLLGAWRSIPPHKPESLRGYLIAMTRRSAVDIKRTRSRQKRSAAEADLSLDELGDIVSDSNTPERAIDRELLEQSLSAWLSGLTEEKRNVFLWRYYFSDPLDVISSRLGFSPSKTKSLLRRLRISLKKYLIKEEIL